MSAQQRYILYFYDFLDEEFTQSFSLYSKVWLRKIHEDLFQTLKQCNEYIHSYQSYKRLYINSNATLLGSCI